MLEVQYDLFASTGAELKTPPTLRKRTSSSTFADNLKLPIHRWFRFSAGFSAGWVCEIIKTEMIRKGREICVLDPFAGSGTTLLCGDACSVPSFGFEAQPFIARIAEAKTRWNCDLDEFRELAKAVRGKAAELRGVNEQYPKLIYKCFPDGTLAELEGLKRAYLAVRTNSAASALVWLCLTSILRSVSPVGTAQWQYVLPNKFKKGNSDVFRAFESQASIIYEDVRAYKKWLGVSRAQLLPESSMLSKALPEGSIDLVVTSPPYANNYDYADATRLEMSFWGEVNDWGDLHEKARKNLLRSSSQHASKVAVALDEILVDPNLLTILPELRAVCNALVEEREKHGGKKDYHLMIAGYFSDMAKVWKNLRRMCGEDSHICFVIGDSAPYGVHVPVEQWIGEIALSCGFGEYRFEKIRDRNIKWKNRKHRVPLHEGNLWVRG